MALKRTKEDNETRRLRAVEDADLDQCLAESILESMKSRHAAESLAWGDQGGNFGIPAVKGGCTVNLSLSSHGCLMAMTRTSQTTSATTTCSTCASGENTI
eukprot:16446640-Heterocapsa_arctica.AAC.1